MIMTKEFPISKDTHFCVRVETTGDETCSVKVTSKVYNKRNTIDLTLDEAHKLATALTESVELLKKMGIQLT